MDVLINLTDREGIAHKHKNYEIIVFTKGSGTFFSENTESKVFPGKFIIVPPNTFHKCTFDTELERIYISGEFNPIFDFTVPVIITDNSENEGLTLARILYNNRYSDTEYVKSLTNAFTHFLLKSYKTDDEISLIIKDIINRITDEFYDSNFNVGELLKKSGYARDYIRANSKSSQVKLP